MSGTGGGGGARFARLPAGFDLNLPFNQQSFTSAVAHATRRRRIDRCRGCGDGRDKEDGGEEYDHNESEVGQLVAAMDWEVYRARLAGIFASVPVLRDFEALSTSSDSVSGPAEPGGAPRDARDILGLGTTSMPALSTETRKRRLDETWSAPGERLDMAGEGAFSDRCENGADTAIFGSDEARKLVASVGDDRFARAAASADLVVEVLVFSRVRRSPAAGIEGGISGGVDRGREEDDDPGSDDNDTSSGTKWQPAPSRHVNGTPKKKREAASSSSADSWEHSQTLVVCGSTLLSDLTAMIRFDSCCLHSPQSSQTCVVSDPCVRLMQRSNHPSPCCNVCRCTCGDVSLPQAEATAISGSCPWLVFGGALYADRPLGDAIDNAATEVTADILERWLQNPVGMPSSTSASLSLPRAHLFSLCRPDPERRTRVGGSSAHPAPLAVDRVPLTGAHVRDLPRLRCIGATADEKGASLLSGLWCHLGDCEHPLVISDVRLPSSALPSPAPSAPPAHLHSDQHLGTLQSTPLGPAAH